MIELPEALTLANQMSHEFTGRIIVEAEVNHSPHKFAFYTGDPASYTAQLEGRMIDAVTATGPYLEILLSDGMVLLLREGVNPRSLAPHAPVPKKHQLCLMFNDETHLVCTVAMYGCFLLADTKAFDDEYYLAAKRAPSPLCDDFSQQYFAEPASATPSNASVKAFLATEQRIPGLGNGVLQDILFNARINPKTKLANLDDNSLERLFQSVKSTLETMTTQGGRNIEKDLYGQPGGYRCILSAKTWQEPCPVCHGNLVKQAYLGGSVYYCPTCQPLT